VGTLLAVLGSAFCEADGQETWNRYYVNTASISFHLCRYVGFKSEYNLFPELGRCCLRSDSRCESRACLFHSINLR
jgi:hypothetical protein